jgi:hypothetical protein
MKNNLAEEEKLIIYIFLKGINAHHYFCNELMRFCQRTDKILGSRATEIVEEQFKFMNSTLVNSFTNMRNGKAPLKLTDFKIVYFDEALDDIF